MILDDVIYPGVYVRPQARVILRDLIDLPSVTMDRITDQLWGGRVDGGPLCAVKQIVVLIVALRKALRPGFRIVHRNGVYVLLREMMA